MKVYRGYRNSNGCEVTIAQNGVTGSLDPGPSQRLFNHSPDGFEWGYGGSGPAQLSLAMLLDHFDGKEGKDELALKDYQDFKFAVIAGFHGDTWSITTAEIDLVLERIAASRIKAPF
jgi:hypothetical protein